jgi:hypothetical protein
MIFKSLLQRIRTSKRNRDLHKVKRIIAEEMIRQGSSAIKIAVTTQDGHYSVEWEIRVIKAEMNDSRQGGGVPNPV